MTKSFQVFIILAAVVTPISSNVLQFIDEVIETKKYDKRLRPLDSGPPVNITNQLFILSLGPVYTETFTFQTEFFLRQWWNDPRIVFNKSDTQLNSRTHPETIIWVPDLTIANANKVEFYHAAVRTVLHGDGRVYVSERMKATCKCNMDLKYYPMDTQKCSMTFESFAYSRKDMMLKWHKKHVIADSIETPGFTVVSATGKLNVMEYYFDNGKEYYDDLIVTFELKRSFLYFVYRVYVPTILLMVFNFGSYWIPASAVPARVTLIVTTFLSSTFILQSVSDETVKVSYTTPLQLFMLVSVILIVVSIVEYMAVLFMKKRREQDSKKSSDKHEQLVQANAGYIEQTPVDRDHDDVSNGAATANGYPNRKIYLIIKKPAPTTKIYTHNIDAAFRLVLPFLYIIFCCIYFTYYLYIVKN